jgi:hypothetical protein
MLSKRAFLGLAAAAITSRSWAAPSPPASTILGMNVPFGPTAFPGSDGLTHLFHELHLTNPSAGPIIIQRIEVLADAGRPIASFDAQALQALIERGPARGADRLSLPGQATAVVFLELILDAQTPVPDRLTHRVVTGSATVNGAVVGARTVPLHVLGPPVTGSGWLADDGPGNSEDNHHRRGFAPGIAAISRRYAIDWVKLENGQRFSGDASQASAYPSYRQPLAAVADATVVFARDGLPENGPGHGVAFKPAIPITIDTVTGNTVTLDLGGGQYAYYCHMQTGSVRVKTGDRVRRGQPIGLIGISGDAREPHLHFEVTTSPVAFMGEGVPYLIDRYGVAGSSGQTHSLPLNGAVVDFS